MAVNITGIRNSDHGNTKIPHDTYHIQLVRDIANESSTYTEAAEKLSEAIGRNLGRMTIQRYMNKYGIVFYKEPERDPHKITRMPRVLYFDLETRMATVEKQVYSLKNYSQYENYKNVKEPVKIVCMAWQWAHESHVQSVSVLNDPERFANDPTDDTYVIGILLSLIEKADCVIAHNGDKFDLRMLRTRAIELGFKPFVEPASIDTLKIARKEFMFLSNSLGYLAKTLGVDEQKGQAPSWEDVWKSDPDVIRECARYCRQDIRTLREVAKILVPWRKNGVDLGRFVHGLEPEICCRNCGSLNIKMLTNTVKKNRSEYQAVKCKDCHSVFGVGKNLVKRHLARSQ